MRRPYVIVTLAWALFGWMHGTQIYFGVLSETGTMRMAYAPFVFSRMLSWLLWAALTPLVVQLARRVPVSRGNVRAIAIHAVASIVIACARVVPLIIVLHFADPFPHDQTRGMASIYVGMLTSVFHIDLLVYWAIAGVVHAIDSRKRLRERELHASRVETQLAQAQLANLRLQLQPHFLFNTLHAIASLVRDGHSPAAVSMIAGLSDLLRYSLDNAGRNLVPLSEELEIVDRYLEIQRTRFSDRLHVTTHVTPDARDAAVPTLLLQPLVENAIRHGIAQTTAGGRLELRAQRDANELKIEVFDDGPALPDGWQSREGIGLSSTRARLAQLYGDSARLELENAREGVVARVRVPFTKDVSCAS